MQRRSIDVWLALCAKLIWVPTAIMFHVVMQAARTAKVVLPWQQCQALVTSSLSQTDALGLSNYKISATRALHFMVLDIYTPDDAHVPAVVF